MCNGCYWMILPNPEATLTRIQQGVPFWLEEGEPCEECVKNRFRLLYATCAFDSCRKGRDCPIHRSLYERPDDWPESYDPPENAQDASRINPYHRNASKQKMEPQEDIEVRWRHYGRCVDEALGLTKDDQVEGVAYKSPTERSRKRAAKIDAAIEAMVRRIEQKRIEEWGDKDSAVGEPISSVMGLLVS